tara:strand:+ start:1545 stop:2972 length:1428 start_codon:yes stop_codon:yes gene_type:complete
MKPEKKEAIHLKEITSEAWAKCKTKTNELSLYHGFSPLNQLDLADRFNTIKQPLNNLINGEISNPTEKQPVTHHHCRQPNYSSNQKLIKFVDEIHNNERLINNKKISHVCQIGIGGSITGPKAIVNALKNWDYNQKIHPAFISSHDEDHISKTLSKLDLESTLFIIASKSGKTIEIEKIISAILSLTKMTQSSFLKNQCVTITTKDSPLNNHAYLENFLFEASVGGRFSTTSPIGTLILGLCFGKSVLLEFLAGANTADQIELSEKNLNSNIAFQMAALNISYRNDYNLENLAMVPYGESLKDLTFFLVQLISESLGKEATLNGTKSITNNCPQIIHGLGPDAQHSIFQQLHQSKTVIPCEFIFTQPKMKNQHHILQQICGQMVALAKGQTTNDLAHYFSGNRPSVLLLLKSNSAAALGELIATYENRVMFEALLLNINAFDQPGVELGKKLTQAMSTEGKDLASLLFKTIQNSD